jgi:hypothetical protein
MGSTTMTSIQGGIEGAANRMILLIGGFAFAVVGLFVVVFLVQRRRKK